jgi:hypothetical protein
LNYLKYVSNFEHERGKNKRKAMNRKFKEETLTSRRETEKRRRSATVCRTLRSPFIAGKEEKR